MKKSALVLVVWIGIMAGLQSCADAERAEPIPVMLLDGESGGPWHDWPATTRALAGILSDVAMFDVTIVTTPADNDFADFAPRFDMFDVIVMNYEAPDGRWPDELKAAFEGYVADGGGLVVVHAADNAFPAWDAFNEMIGVGGWRGRDENAGPYWYFSAGRLVADESPGPAGSHGARLPFEITVRDAAHPIMAGLPARWMHGEDELYAQLRGPGSNMTVLATAFSDPDNAGTGRDEPMLMVVNYGRGRVFHTTLGHDVRAMSSQDFVVTLQRGTQWAATGEVSQPVPDEFPGVASRYDSRFGPPTGSAAGEWIALFNGRDLDGWTAKISGHPSGTNFADTFRVEDGLLTASYENYTDFDEQFGHLFYEHPYSHYRLRIEYRFIGEQAPNGPTWAQRNSGVMLHAQPPETMPPDQNFPISIEIQFLGGLGDGEARATGNVCSPGTHIVYEGRLEETHCINSGSPTLDGDQWVSAEVLVLGNERIVSYINGEAVLEFGGTAFGGDFVSGHRPELKPDGAPLAGGYIALQGESHPVQFRRVELLNLKGCMDSAAQNYGAHFVEPDPAACDY